MTTITVYDPAMCCSTGICGTDVDQQLVNFAADLDWLKARGIEVRRINLGQEPTEFTANEQVNALMQESGGDDLPAILVDGKLVSRACYPSREKLADWCRIENAGGDNATKQSGSCAPQSSGSCCGGE